MYLRPGDLCPPVLLRAKRYRATQAMAEANSWVGRRRTRARVAVVSSIAVLALLGALLATALTGKASRGKAVSTPGVYALGQGALARVKGLPATELLATDSSLARAPTPVTSGKLPTLGGKPAVLYVGAEYCPYCEAERWPLLMALSKVGSFSGLRGTASSSTDILPSTPTVTLFGSRYKSATVGFVPVELYGSVPGPSGRYPTLQQLSPAQKAVMAKLDPTGSIPFIDIAGRYVVLGAQYDSRRLSGLSFEAAASYLAADNPTGRAARAAVGEFLRDIRSLAGNRAA